MTTYAILHKNDPERCIRFFRQYCKDWCPDYEGIVRAFFKHLSAFALESRPYCKVDGFYDTANLSENLDKEDTLIDFEGNPRRRAL